MNRGTRGPPRDVVERRGRAQPARDQRAHDLTDRQDRPSTARQPPVNRVLHLELAQEMLDQQQRPDTPARPGHRRIQPRERSRESLKLPRVLQRILPTKVCHNAMTDLAVLIPVALHQLQVAVLAARPLDLGLLDEHVATTLPALSDGTDSSIEPQLPQHVLTTHPQRNPANQHAPSRSARTTHPQPRKTGLAGRRLSGLPPPRSDRRFARPRPRGHE